MFSTTQTLQIVLIVIVTLVIATVFIWVWCAFISSTNPIYTFYIWWNELILGKFPVESEVLRYSKTKLREKTICLEIERALRQRVITQAEASAWKKEILEVCPSYTHYKKGRFSFSDYARIQEVFDNIVLRIWDKSM